MDDVVNLIDGQVQVIFERGEGNQVFRDALWMTQAEYDALPAGGLKALQDERHANWLAVVNALPQE